MREQYYAQKTREHDQRQQRLKRVLQKHGLLEQKEKTTPTTDELAVSSDSSTSYFSVPANLRPLVELPKERREKFLEHLQQVTQAAFRLDQSPPSRVESPGSIEDESTEIATPVSDKVAAACGTCQGYCCRHGAHHAFYSAVHIQTLRQLHPTYSAMQIIELIASHLPAVSVQDSCVMHGPQGCQLPRELRADLCNSFECAELVHIMQSADKSPMVIVAIEGEQLVRQKEYCPPSSINDCHADGEN